jgi:DNA sulfur modification protein DndD
MQIERVKILNFGPYYGEHQLVFPGDGSGVHLVRGDNGQGKTSILRAILWGLYGRVADRKGQSIRPTSLLNRSSKQEGSYQFGVTIQFNHEGKGWSLSRQMEARNHLDRAYEMRVFLVEDGTFIPNPEDAIRRILPDDVSRFFFFDGEMLRDYEELLDQSRPSMALLRDSIEKVLGIPYLRLARNDLQAVKARLENERGRLMKRLGGEDLRSLNNDFQAISEKIAEDEQRLKGLDSEMARLDTEIADGKRRLTEIDRVRDLAHERSRLDEHIAGLELAKRAESTRLKEKVALLYRTVVFLSSEDIIAKLETKQAATMEKYNIKQQLLAKKEQLERGIDTNRCRLCGTELNPEKIREMRDDLQQVEIQIKDLTQVPEPNLEFDNHVNRLRSLRAQIVFAHTFRDIESRLSDFDHKIAASRANLDEVQEKLKAAGVGEEEIHRIELAIEENSRESGRLQGEKKALQQDRMAALELKADLDQRIKSIDQDEVKTLTRRIDLVGPLIDVFEEAISAYRNQRRKFVEEVASDIFKELRTKASFSRLTINDQFGLNIITDTGNVIDRAEWRSAGEEQVVALALMAALNRCAQVQAPVFMDTPFGRLDVKHGRRILTFVPKIAKQVVLFVTDREVTKDDEQFLKGLVKSDHTLIHKGEHDGSTIIRTAN